MQPSRSSTSASASTNDTGRLSVELHCGHWRHSARWPASGWIPAKGAADQRSSRSFSVW